MVVTPRDETIRLKKAWIAAVLIYQALIGALHQAFMGAPVNRDIYTHMYSISPLEDPLDPLKLRK